MRKGQAVLEYVLALAGMIVVSAILWYVVEAAVKSAVRTEKLVSSEYP